jgi:MFS transporter, AAHS family, 4-hydroxybenzoate transporter
MTTQSEVQVSRLLDERGLSSFQINLLIWSFFIVLIDGYDIAAIAFAAPHLVRAWGVAPGALGPVFSASLVGILFGSAIFGWVGDRYGRKAALIGSNLWFGIFTLAAAYSSNLDQMFWLRLLAGLGIGGVIPNVVAVNAESAPRHLRATLAIIAVGCVPIGGAIPGFVAVALVPTYGGRSCFKSAVSCRSSLPLRPYSACPSRSNTWRCTNAIAAAWKRSSAPSGLISRCPRMHAS